LKSNLKKKKKKKKKKPESTFFFLMFHVFFVTHKIIIVSTYYIEYNDGMFILRTTAKSILELDSAIKSKLELEENIKIRLHFNRNGKLFVLDDMEDLKEGMTIKVSIRTISTHPQQKNMKTDKIDGIFINFPFLFSSLFRISK